MAGGDLIFLGLLLALLLPICLSDLQQRRIPNALNAAVALLGLAHAAVAAPGLFAVLWTLAQGVLAVALFAATARLVRLVNRAALVGGGDLKLLVAASFWVGMDGSVVVLILACLLLFVLILAMAPWRGIDMRRLHPFGPMLAVSLLAVVVASFVHGGATHG